MQVYNSNVPGTGQFFPPGTGPGETANSGVWRRFRRCPSRG